MSDFDRWNEANAHAEPNMLDRIAGLEAENKRLREALAVADEAINPKDRGGISMHVWGQRLKAATEIIRAALKETEDDA